jgi:glycosyltransferase involved in cell wall biosynthesis
MTASISVVVPFFNRDATILTALESVACQTLRPERLIVVDDGSTDDGRPKVERWLIAHRDHINGQLIHQPNRGVSAARNRGLLAAGDCSRLAFLDSDDCWPDDFLARASEVLDACPAAVAATCNREQHCAGRSAPLLQDLASLAANPIVWMFRHGAAIASATLFRAAAVRRRAGFDERLATGEDAALFLRLCLDGPWLHVPGRPVVFDRRLAHGGPVEGNLSHKFRDNYRRWAEIYEDFVVRGGGRRAVRPRVYRRLLGTLWYRAGRELARAGSVGEARDCYQASLRWNSMNFKAWHRLARTYIRNAGADGVDGPLAWSVSQRKPEAPAASAWIAHAHRQAA